jgi:hypothetical protein
VYSLKESGSRIAATLIFNTLLMTFKPVIHTNLQFIDNLKRIIGNRKRNMCEFLSGELPDNRLYILCNSILILF